MFSRAVLTALLAASAASAAYKPSCGVDGLQCCFGKYCRRGTECVEGTCTSGSPPDPVDPPTDPVDPPTDPVDPPTDPVDPPPTQSPSPPDGCGDGTVDADAGEDCEPPNSDGCDGSCNFVPCPDTPDCPDAPDCPAPETCPDPDCPAPEECPPPEDCPTVPTPGPPSCGDGTVDEGEDCEPPNEGSCNGNCQTVPGTPPVEPGCGNGVVEDGEDCEPPSTGDCNAECKIPPRPDCGDGVVQPPEECEPPGAGSCSDECRIVGPEPTPPAPECGDNIVQPPEECEPPGVGNCNDNCRIPAAPECGDNIVQQGEQCEPPGVGNCDANCRIPVQPECGDGIVQDGEDCEPPGTGGCTETCTFVPAPTPPTTPPRTEGPCVECEDKSAGKPVQVTLQWDCDGPAPPTITGGGKKGGTPQYDANAGIVRFGNGGDKLGSQIDFNGESLHTSCSAPFYIGIRTFTGSEDKKDQSCTSQGCWKVIDAVSDNGSVYCDRCEGGEFAG